MGYFPLCMDLKGKRVLLVGDGPEIAYKLDRLGPFGAELVRCDDVTAEMLDENVAFVVVGDTPEEKAARISALCHRHRIPVNVVDKPGLCSFVFPALITRGDATVSISTGGKAPGIAAYLARRIEEQLPPNTGELIDWINTIRKPLYEAYPKEQARHILRAATAVAFAEGRCLGWEEIRNLE